jgi:hypothetical protein
MMTAHPQSNTNQRTLWYADNPYNVRFITDTPHGYARYLIQQRAATLVY